MIWLWLFAQKTAHLFIQDPLKPRGAQPAPHHRPPSCTERLLGRPPSVLSSSLSGAAVLNGTASARETAGGRRESEGGAGNWAEQGQRRPAAWSGGCQGWLCLPAGDWAGGLWLVARLAGDDPPPWRPSPAGSCAHCLSTNQEHMQLGEVSCCLKGPQKLQRTDYQVLHPLGPFLTPGLRTCCSFNLDALPAPLRGLMTFCSLFFFVN